MNRRQFMERCATAAIAAGTFGFTNQVASQSKLVLKATDVHPLGYPTVEAVVRMGRTMVLCTCAVENTVPPFLVGTGKGWLTSEISTSTTG